MKTCSNAGGTATLLYFIKIQLRERKAPVYQSRSILEQRCWRMIKEAERHLDYARVDWEYRK